MSDNDTYNPAIDFIAVSPDGTQTPINTVTLTFADGIHTLPDWAALHPYITENLGNPEFTEACKNINYMEMLTALSQALAVLGFAEHRAQVISIFYNGQLRHRR